MGMSLIRVGHAAAAKNNRENKFKRDTCSTGGFIKSPTSGQSVDVSSDVMFAWDSSCLNITGADIYLYAPYQDSSLLQMFENVDFSKGSYNTTLKPKWWNSTSSVELQLTIVDTGSPAFLATLPAGPIWTAKYDSSKANSDESDIGTTSSSDSNVTEVNNLESGNSGGLSKGTIAAAVIIPLLVIGIALGVYIKWTRMREKVQRKRWSEAVDKRMSVISVDWRSLGTHGAEAAIRASMADPSRNSVWSSGNAGVGIPRPSSTFAVEGNASDEHGARPDMAQIRRPGVGPRGPVASAGDAGRASRISFAADTRFSRSSTGDGLGSRGRPSGESRRTGVASRAFHSAYIPPVPIPSRLSEYVPEAEANLGSDYEDNNGGLMSPTQQNGPVDLSVEDIHARMSGIRGENSSRLSLDAMMPALSMMRTGNSSQADLVLQRSEQPYAESIPQHVESSYVTMPPAAVSPIRESTPVQPSTASVMSPDEMLRAYAERRRTGASGIASPPGTPAPAHGISFPMPVVTTGSVSSPISTTMRTLYSPSPSAGTFGFDPESTTAATPVSARPDSTTNPFRKSMAARQSTDTKYDDDDAYYGISH